MCALCVSITAYNSAVNFALNDEKLKKQIYSWYLNTVCTIHNVKIHLMQPTLHALQITHNRCTISFLHVSVVGPQHRLNGAPNTLYLYCFYICNVLTFYEVKLYFDWNSCAPVFCKLGQVRGAACVNIGLPDDGTPGVPKHVGRIYCVDCA